VSLPVERLALRRLPGGRTPRQVRAVDEELGLLDLAVQRISTAGLLLRQLADAAPEGARRVSEELDQAVRDIFALALTLRGGEPMSARRSAPAEEPALSRADAVGRAQPA
jgi:hypothetical protein